MSKAAISHIEDEIAAGRMTAAQVFTQMRQFVRYTPQAVLSLERWGRGIDPSPHLLQPLEDGYWTPWHIAQKRLENAAVLLNERDQVEAFVRDLLWNEHPECCGFPVVGAEYMGQQEQVCCGNPEPAMLNDAQIVATLRAKFPEQNHIKE